MRKKDNPDNYSPNPIFKINEFEEAAGAILDLAKDQAIRNIEEAKKGAKEIIQKERENLINLEKEYSEKIAQELNLEKGKMAPKIKEELGRIEKIPDEKIKQAVAYLIERILPK